MLKIPKEYLIEKIKEKSGLSEIEIQKKINSKLEELSGLISEDGAAHIIANEYGVKVMEASENLQIKNVFAGMRNIEIVGKVTRIFEVRTFQSGERSGKVGSFNVADASGQARIVAWGNQADMLEKLKEGDTVKLKAGYAKENQGRIELHLNDRSQIIINPEGVSIGEIKTRQDSSRKKIVELAANDNNVEIMGTIVQAFDPRYFEVCPYCFKRTKGSGEGFTCDTHGPIKPDYSYVMNVVLDDGTETIRTIFFKNQMQHLVNMTHEEILAKRGGSLEDLKNNLLGKIIKVTGKTSSNEMFSRIEFVAQIVDANPNAEAELKRLGGAAKEQPKAKEMYSPKPQPAKIEPKAEPKPEAKHAPKKADKPVEEDIMSLDDIEEVKDDDIYE